MACLVLLPISFAKPSKYNLAAMRFWQIFRLLLVVTALLVAGYKSVLATGVVVEPAFQSASIGNEQKQTELSVQLTNQTDSTQVFKLSTVDIRQFDEAGRIGLVDKPVTDNQYALAPYLHLAENQIELAAKEKRSITVTIQNSLDLSPGGHYGAVVAEVVSSGSEGEQVVVPAVSAIILVHKVGGERFHLNLKSIRLPDIWFTMPKKVQLLFENHGNVHVIPRGQVILVDIFNRRVAEGIINDGSLVVMPETQRALTTELAVREWAIPFLPLTLQVHGTTDVGNIQFSQSAIVSFLPLLTIVGLLLGLAGLVFFIRRYAVHKRS